MSSLDASGELPRAKARVGFIGFGEVASTLSKPLRENGASVAAYDVLLRQEQGEEVLRRRAQTEGIQFCSLAEMIGSVSYVLSTVTTDVAPAAAREAAPHLKPGQVYVDLNSTAPSIKIEIGGIVAASGADFVEGAILGAVGATGARTRILVAGERAPEVAETLTSLGLRVLDYGPEVGRASTFKMLRSIFAKGLEALLLETLIAGKKAGIEHDLWDDILDLMRNPFDRVGSNWVQTHAVAHRRRYHEIVQVLETMREIGVEPVMTCATEGFFKRSLSLGLQEGFPEKPDSMWQVIDYLEERLSRAR